MFTRKNYQTIARIVNDTFGDDIVIEYAPCQLAERLADYFAEDSPKFNKEKFLKACGIRG